MTSHKQKVERKLSIWRPGSGRWRFWFGNFTSQPRNYTLCHAVHQKKKPNISLMGNNCRRVGSDAFICTGGVSLHSPRNYSDTTNLSKLRTAEPPSLSRVLRRGHTRRHAVPPSEANAGGLRVTSKGVGGGDSSSLTIREPRAKPWPRPPASEYPGNG